MINEIRERGFSLVELMVVIAIIAILATIAAPSISEYIRRAKGRDVARSIANSVRFARDQATSRGQVVIVEVDRTASGGNGVVRVLRLVDNTSSGGDAGSADAGDAGSTGTVALPKSCKEAVWKLGEGDLITEVAYEYDLGDEEPDMAIRGYDPVPSDPMRLCAMPDGRVGNMRGLPFRPSNSSCTDQEMRIWVSLEGENLSTTPFGSEGYSDCVEDGDPETEPSKYKARQDQKDSRDLVNFWMITVSYNGSVDATQ
jgi:prepilin-type N-terminal cleavage/methylation domain-containing protein